LNVIQFLLFVKIRIDQNQKAIWTGCTTLVCRADKK